MPQFLSPIGNSQIMDANGNPLVGGFLETYLAGTSTPRTTFTTQAGTTPQGAVMTLNSLGYPVNGAVWMVNGVALKFVVKNALGVVQSTFDNVSGIGDVNTAPDEWVVYAATPTYVSPTVFTVVNDQTNTFQALRKLKSTNTGGTVYSAVVSSVFAASATTVTVVNSVGALDAGLSAVSYGLMAPNNPSIPPIDEEVNAQTGTAYTYTRGDKGKLVTHSNAAAIAGTLPTAATVGKSWWVDVQNRGAGVLTITPTTSTVDGAATLVLATNQGARLVSDGVNYFTQRSTAAAQKIINVVEATPFTTASSTTVILPLDDTIPQITEGAELQTVTITPTSATSRLRVEFQGYFSISTSAAYVSAALFQDAIANALTAAGNTMNDNVAFVPITLSFEMAAGTTSAITFRVRYGPSVGTGYVNQNGALARRFGGVMRTTFRVTEMAA